MLFGLVFSPSQRSSIPCSVRGKRREEMNSMKRSDPQEPVNPGDAGEFDVVTGAFGYTG
jgi:hypothetical protein